ncbi:MAG TPA: sugar ABC transporter ATP-binding protein [Thermotogota bacterium]|nr:sugar ABC transporter ATP-binding protein [Thermotogota bacterium]HPJ88981.1 sugar ABC transporter ATP-binding protein [Thermotogota bacterium]HPR97262.1 sugar ABC transporter ATP-binding protein [Thermotogota bacterium]
MPNERFGETALKVEKINKAFPNVKALTDVSLEIRGGEIRALVGENGAGKSTLIKIITGAYTRDSGTLYIGNREIKKNSPLLSKSLGVYAVYQAVMLANDLTVAENFFLGLQPGKAGFVNWKRMYKESEEFMNTLGLNIPVTKTLGELSIAESEMVTIAAALWHNPKVVIFDEPTAMLTKSETEILFRIIRELKKKGIAVIYISHNLEEIFQICDTITILKDGTVVDTVDADTLSEESLIPLMVGRDINEMYSKKEFTPGKEILKVEGLSGEKFKDISFNVKRREVLGIFGLMGAGRTEIARAIYGADKVSAGQVEIDGQTVSIKRPIDALRNRLGYLPEDRKDLGLFLEQDVDFNVNIINYDKSIKGGIINYAKTAEIADNYIDMLSIKVGGPYQKVSELSGGNQQKVIIGRWLARNPDILIFDEPTVGIDVGTKSEIYKLIGKILEQDKGIILISSYFPELLGLSDRVIVISNGRIAGEVERRNFSEERLLALAMKYTSNSAIREEISI